MKEFDFNSREIVNRFSNMLYNIAVGYLKNKDDAEDIVQDAFMKLISYSRKRKFKSEEHEKYWLIRVVINLCNNELKSAKRRNNVSLTEIEYIEENYSKEDYITDIVNALEPKYKDVFRLFYVEDFKISEISKILSISENNVKTRLKRAREKLRKELELGGEKENG